MASTYTSLHYHIVFSTKLREPRLAQAWRGELHEYLGVTVRGLSGSSEGIGGMADHAHLLVSLRATHCLADFMRELKKASSSWIRETFRQSDFCWQEGYAAFTVSASGRKSVHNYIANQERHHRKRSFRAELIELLRKSEVAFDEQYLD